MSPVIRDGRGIQSTSEVGLVGEPSGPVERRAAEDHEREGFVARRAGPGLLVVPRRPPDPGYEERRVAKERAFVARLPPAEPSPPEAPMSDSIAAPPPTELPIVVGHIDALRALDVALTEAIAAWDAREELRHAETRWLAAQKALEVAWGRTGLRTTPWTSRSSAFVSRPAVDEVDPEPDVAAGGGSGPDRDRDARARGDRVA